MRSLLSSAVLALAVFSVAPLQAQPTSIPGLFVTGVDALGNRLTAGSLDPHYTILETGLAAKVVNSNAGTCQLAGTWLTPPGQSCWIWEEADGGPVNVTRTFRTTFDLTGFDANSALLSGLWATDNAGLDILINGSSTGQGNANGFGVLTAFSVSSGFVAGLNTLDFVVQDFGVVSGFLVGDMSGRATPATVVPEPASIALMAFGLVGVAVASRRRRVN